MDGISRQRTAFSQTGSLVILCLPKVHALQMPSRGACAQGQKLICGACDLRSKSSWIRDRCARYVAPADGIWLNVVAGDSRGPPEVSGIHRGQELTCVGYEPQDQKQVDH